MKLLIITGIIFMAGMLGVSMGYHRYLAHKSFQPKRWFELLIIFLGLPAGTPIQWAGNHRYHHAHADTPLDPHSPHHGGFWWAHNGWYINSKNSYLCFLYALAGPLRSLFDGWHRPRSNQQFNHYAADIANDKILSWMSRPNVYLVLVSSHTLGAFFLAWLVAGIDGVLLAYACYLFVYNIGDGVDSFGHMYGSRNEGSTHKATNSWIMGVLAFGDGWHANHHDKPSLARHGRNNQFDLSYITLKTCEKLGIVRNIKVEK